MLASFLSPAARGAAKKPDQDKQDKQDKQEKTKKSPPKQLDIGKKATPDRWRPMIGAGDSEFKQVWDMFDKIRHQGDNRMGLDDILEKYFTPHEASLFIPADRERSPGIAYIQRQASRRYHKLVKTERFAGLKQASSAEVLISKLTMLYFGLPVAPYTFVSFDDKVPGNEDDDGIVYDEVELVHPEYRPLKFLNKYTERSYGKDISRRPDPLYEMFYSGLSELQWAGHIPYEIPSFGQLLNMASTGGPGSTTKNPGLRGGAGSQAELRGGKLPRTPSEDGYTWRMYGYQGQIVIGERLVEFQSAVDRLLGFTVRGECMATLHHFNKKTGKLELSFDFKTGSKNERAAFEFIQKTPDPDEKKCAFFLTRPHEQAPEINNLFPGKDNKHIVKVRAAGKAQLNCAYIYLPHFDRDHIGANDYDSIFVAAARILFAPLNETENPPAILPSVVGFTFGGDHETPYKLSFGGLNISHFLVTALCKRAKEGNNRDLIMTRGPSLFDGEMGLFMPGLTYDDSPAKDSTAKGVETSAEWKLSAYNSISPDGEPAAQVLRNHMWTRFSPSELKDIHHVEIWTPGEAIMDPKVFPKSLMINVLHGADKVADTALNQLLKHVVEESRGDQVFFSAKPAYQSGHKVILLNKDGKWTRPEAIGSCEHPQCFSLQGDMDVETFRQNVTRSIVSDFDNKYKDGAIYIQQSEKVWDKYDDMPADEQKFIRQGAKVAGLSKAAFMAQLRAMMEAGRNNYVVHPHTTEGQWEVIKRFIVSREIYVHMIPRWSVPESQPTELFRCFMPLNEEAQKEAAVHILGQGNGKANDANDANDAQTSDSDDLMEISSTGPLNESGLDPNRAPGAQQYQKSQKPASGPEEILFGRSASQNTSQSIVQSNTQRNTQYNTQYNTQKHLAKTTAKGAALGGKVVPFGPPAIQGKWPLTDAERVKFLREQTYGNPISIYDGGRPHMPINAPPIETFLRGGAGLPSVSIAMMTLTEQRHLQEQYLQMRNLALERTMPCPYRSCGYSFSVDKLDDMRAHIEASHLWDSCNFCEERLYKYWGREKRLHHYNTKHRNMLSSTDAGASLALTLGEKQPAQHDKGKKAVSFEAPKNPTITVTKPTKAPATKPKPTQGPGATPKKLAVPGKPQRQTGQPLEPTTKTVISSGSKRKGTGAPKNKGDRESLDDGIVDDGYDEERDEEYEDEEDAESEEEYEEDDDEDYTEKPRTPKPGRNNASRTAGQDTTPTSSAKRKRAKTNQKTGEKDATYRDSGDMDDGDDDLVVQLGTHQPGSSRGKKHKVSHPNPGPKDAEWIDSGNSDDNSIPSEDDEPGRLAAPKRREDYRLRAENDPSWRPRKGSHANDDDDPELEASAVPEGEDSVLADIQGQPEAGSSAKKRSPLADPSYRLPKGALGEDDDPALIRSAVPEPGLPGILLETPGSKRKLPAADARSAGAFPGGANIEIGLQDTTGKEAEPARKKARKTPAPKKTAASPKKTPAPAKAAPAAKTTANKTAAEDAATRQSALFSTSLFTIPAAKSPAAKSPAAKTPTARPKPTPAKRKPVAQGEPVRRSTRTVSKELQ
ncbi:hypothetical protein MCOR27_005178 [Pyricularia oryzae]|nr:hypothetical protein MCOR01_000667 [Pyricularia oryzae]KAI6279420.1 hypothetical protein MCOR27_005178 [Pyricularia oryzae]KAI6320760.1 hypothetical protein MCOR29_005126 [Pyricularia oryzae]KAI6374144.1 hypothetical protein MCOR32_005588 [Pyricularia oryzae]KAI6504476.1 hypothetical protein MCOR11_000099 [Pyricularia oryzae]